MKSIIQEASSIAKAVELAWAKAGKPQQFSIKIFQESEKNFLGMTSKPAKIAFIFNDTQDSTNKIVKKHIEQSKQLRTSQPQPKEFKKQEREKGTQLQELSPTPKVSTTPKDQEVSSKTSTLWITEHSEFVRTWLQDILQSLGYQQVKFSLDTQKQLLKIHFSVPLINDAAKEKHLFRNIAFLMLQSLRREFKRPLRHARVVLLSGERQ
ncbi:hypothetical protein KJZ61_03545 [Candidatus Dependentiae bacterium]|nr:hypothetical protein [Candidatus Dependentiae bacterium]